jgi:GTPase SAR1 family protein
VVLVGNKIDLPRSARGREAGKKLAEEAQASFVETSAKTGENVPKLFEELLDLVTSEK